MKFHHSEHLTPSPSPTPMRDEVLPEMSASELLVLPSWAKAIIPRPTHQQPRHYRERQPSNCHQTFLLSARSPRTGVGGVQRSLPTVSSQRTEQQKQGTATGNNPLRGSIRLFFSGLFPLLGGTTTCTQPMTLRGLSSWFRSVELFKAALELSYVVSECIEGPLPGSYL